MSRDDIDRVPGVRGRREGYANRGLDMKLRKCDVRLTKEEDRMLDYLAERNETSRSEVFRKALRDMFRYNTTLEDD